MRNDEFLAIKNQLPELRKQLVDSRHGRIPRSIEYLETAIADSPSAEDKAALYTLILSECSRAKNRDLVTYFLRQQVLDLPGDPLALTSLAAELAQDRDTTSEALTLIFRAVALAKEQDRQVKHSLACQARVAVAAGDYKVFNDSLRELINDAGKRRAEDHGFEFDFLDKVDEAKADQALISQYRALAH